MSEIKDDLRTVKRYASEVIRVQTQLNGISTELESIDKKLKYDFSSIYIDSYEGIKHFRYNRETGKINKRDSRSFGGWGSPFGSDD